MLLNFLVNMKTEHILILSYWSLLNWRAVSERDLVSLPSTPQSLAHIVQCILQILANDTYVPVVNNSTDTAVYRTPRVPIPIIILLMYNFPRRLLLFNHII